MNISEQGLNLIKKWESLRLVAYQDQVGVWTIGYGHTYGVKPSMAITSDAADLLLLMDARDAVKAVNSLVNATMLMMQLTQSQFDVLVDFTFNLGPGNLKNSTLLRLINNGDITNDKAEDELMKWIYAGHEENDGLRNRRKDEVLMWKGQWV